MNLRLSAKNDDTALDIRFCTIFYKKKRKKKRINSRMLELGS